MKNIKTISLLLAPLLIASVALAQTEDSTMANSTPEENSISAARSRYTQTSDMPPDASNTTLAQLRRGGAGAAISTPGGYSRGTYQTPWMDHGNAGHILIGAAIGFGVGAAIGASNSARNGTPVAGGIIIGGGLFGFLGGCVGKAVGDLQGLHYASARRKRIHSHPRRGPRTHEESELRRHSKSTKKKTPRGRSQRKPASSGQPSVESNGSGGHPVPAVP